MRGNTPGLGQLLRILHASAGGGFGMAARASRTNSSLVMMAGVFPQPLTPCGAGVAFWSIPPIVTHGAPLGYGNLIGPGDGYVLMNLAV